MDHPAPAGLALLRRPIWYSRRPALKAGLLWGAGSIAGAFVLTFAGVGILVGLILLIIGLAIRYG